MPIVIQRRRQPSGYEIAGKSLRDVVNSIMQGQLALAQRRDNQAQSLMALGLQGKGYRRAQEARPMQPMQPAQNVQPAQEDEFGPVWGQTHYGGQEGTSPSPMGAAAEYLLAHYRGSR